MKVVKKKENHTWHKPMHGFLKLNVDASFHEDAPSGATAAVLRDVWGHFIVAETWFVPDVSDAATAEDFALRNGINLAGNVGCSKLVAKSDCSVVIEAVKDPYSFNGAQAATFVECAQLAREFGQIQFSSCNREANQVGDDLAKEAYVLKNSSV